MASVIQYLKTYQDQTFNDMPLNDVDRLVFNELSYLPVELLSVDEDGLTLQQVGRSLLSKAWKIHTNNPYLVTLNRLRILRYLSDSKRYQKITLHRVNFETTLDYGYPFVCLTLYHPDFPPFVVFRGTDDTMLGWQESLALTFEEDLASYRLATNYLKQTIDHFKEPIEVSGHSKGGHLAYMASYYLTVEERRSIQRLTAFDAPGVFDWVMEDKYFQRFIPRIIAYCPNQSIFGRLLTPPVQPAIVEAKDASGLVQHILNQWETFDSRLKLTDQFSLESDFSTDLFSQWHTQTPVTTKQRLHQLTFSVLSRAGVDSFNTLIRHFWSSSSQIWLEVHHLPEEDRKFLLEQSKLFQQLYEDLKTQPQYKGVLNTRYLEWLVPVLSAEKIHSFMGLFH
ncbi:Mbeg1-like protein [Dolosicoccus paucivorans]|uniref:Mbeg1-like protein n=1 Tax=Dolosicoccus paucivorans TaxID=84521 RepID=UPI00088CD37C|nr:Mbeg1-like protein [Dolosicoccus paucivorans]SDI44263.1 Protein of unknown function [Dolosicoccus paucivorans]